MQPHDDSSDSAEAAHKVVAEVTNAQGKVRRSLQVHRPQPADTTFLAASAKGMGITLKHYARNLFSGLRKKDVRTKAGAPEGEGRSVIETVQYPEEKVTYPERFLGLHRLMLREAGAVGCVACKRFRSARPAHCSPI